MSDVIKLVPKEIGENYRFKPDDVLEQAKGRGSESLVVLAQMPDGSIEITGTANLGETVVLLELAKHTLLFGDHG